MATRSNECGKESNFKEWLKKKDPREKIKAKFQQIYDQAAIK